MAYILGFFAADGYITVNNRGGQFWCIQITDGGLLKEIKKTIRSEHKIGIRKGKGNERDLYRIQIGSLEMCDDLRRLGFSERKTKNLVGPKVPIKYFSSFVRGYFDGDGHTWSGWMHKERKTQTYVIQTVFTSCSGDFLKGLASRLESFSIKNGRIRQEKERYYRLVYSVKDSLKLYDFMYNSTCSSKLLLKRKKARFEKYLKTIQPFAHLRL